MVDDGEKFGVWPGTHAHVYEKGWLDRFFDRLLATEWLDLVTLSDIVDRVEATDRVYLPTASYREMGEWVLPPAARRRLERAKDALERLGGDAEHAELLRGGFWRNFLARYPEVADTYWKMLRLSGAVRGALARAPHDSRLREAQIALWRGQANDAYWHGVFGGCYLPHLRRAVKTSLVACERLLGREQGAPAIEWQEEDLNGDGRVEVSVRTPELAVTLHPERGGSLTELAYLARDLDVADVLTRRREGYHARVRDPGVPAAGDAVRTIHAGATAREAGLAALLEYDRFRRASLLDGLFAEDAAVDPLHPWAAARAVVGERPMARALHVSPDAGEPVCPVVRLDDLPLALEKT